MKKMNGFTLIELVMVIVILGILAATALPKFVDLAGDARTASINSAAGAVKSAMAIVHAKSLIDGNAHKVNSEIVIEGQQYNIVYGYPRQDQIGQLAGLSDTDFKNFNGVITLKSNAKCTFTYSPATAADVPATISAVTGC